MRKQLILPLSLLFACLLALLGGRVVFASGCNGTGSNINQTCTQTQVINPGTFAEITVFSDIPPVTILNVDQTKQYTVTFTVQDFAGDNAGYNEQLSADPFTLAGSSPAVTLPAVQISVAHSFTEIDPG